VGEVNLIRPRYARPPSPKGKGNTRQRTVPCLGATYVATDQIKHKVVPLGFNTFLHSTGGKVLPYGFAAYAWGHTAYSIFCTDPIARANQRGYGLR